jgi:hypothetical protein
VEDNAAVSSSNIVRLNNADVKVICLSYLALGSSPAHLRHSLKRIRRQIASATLIVGLWGHADDENREHLQTAAADFYVCSLREALSLCIGAVSGGLATSQPTHDRSCELADVGVGQVLAATSATARAAFSAHPTVVQARKATSLTSVPVRLLLE